MINNISTEELFAPGHRACSGCGASLAMRLALKAAGPDTIVVQATGCMEVVSTPYPETSWRVPWIHVAFENAPAVASGIDLALKKSGMNAKILVIGGDGSTFDIGFQALSGAFERRHKLLYLCYTNEAYMNTGIQRSGSTPKYAATTTSPAGKKIHGKTEYPKNMPIIMAAHKAPYVATANIAFPQDFVEKMKKGFLADGPAYVQVFTPCPLGWNFPSNKTIQVAKMAYSAKMTPLFEMENGLLKFTKKPSPAKPIEEYLRMQARFKHMTPDEVKDFQARLDEEFSKLERLEECGIRF